MPIAQEMKNITENIAVSYGERMSWLGDLEKSNHQMMSRIKKDHKVMADELGTFLNDGESARISNFKGMLASIQVRQNDREKEVTSLIKKFETESKEMAAELKVFLGNSESQRLEEFKNLLGAIKNRQRARKKEVAEFLTAFQKDLNEAQGHWQNLAKIMASKRTSKKVPITEVPKEAQVSKKVEKEAEEAFEEGNLKTNILKVIKANPEGISARQIADKFSMAHIRLAKPIKALIDENKVFKRDSLYFPA